MDAGVEEARLGGVQRGGDDAEATAKSMGFPSLAALTLDRIRFSVGGYGGSGQPRG